MKTIEFPTYSKHLLREILNYNQSKLNREINVLLPELLEKFPRYNQRAHILPENVFFWIAEQLGFERETIQNRIISTMQKKELNHYEMIRNFGAGKEKPFS